MRSRIEKRNVSQNWLGPILMLLCTLSVVIAQEKSVTDPTEKLRGEYQKKIEALDSPSGDLNERYLQELKKLETSAKAAGDLKQLLAIREEIKVFSDGGTAVSEKYDELRKLQGIYLKQRKLHQDGIFLKQIEVRDEYVEKLKELRSEFTKQDKIESALAVQSEIDGFGDGLGSLVAKAAEESTAKPPEMAKVAVPKPKPAKEVKLPEAPKNESRPQSGTLRVAGGLVKIHDSQASVGDAPKPPTDLNSDIIAVSTSPSRWLALRKDGKLVNSHGFPGHFPADDAFQFLPRNFGHKNGFAALDKFDRIHLGGDLAMDMPAAVKILKNEKATFLSTFHRGICWTDKKGNGNILTSDMVAKGEKPAVVEIGNAVKCWGGYWVQGDQTSEPGWHYFVVFLTEVGSLKFWSSHDKVFVEPSWENDAKVIDAVPSGSSIWFLCDDGAVRILQVRTPTIETTWKELGNEPRYQRIAGQSGGFVYETTDGKWGVHRIDKKLTASAEKLENLVKNLEGKTIIDFDASITEGDAVLIWAEE